MKESLKKINASPKSKTLSKPTLKSPVLHRNNIPKKNNSGAFKNILKNIKEKKEREELFLIEKERKKKEFLKRFGKPIIKEKIK